MLVRPPRLRPTPSLQVPPFAPAAWEPVLEVRYAAHAGGRHETTRVVNEVKDPLSAILIGAEAALRWLAKEPPDLEEARAMIELVIGNSHRAADATSLLEAIVRSGDRVCLEGDSQKQADLLGAALLAVDPSKVNKRSSCICAITVLSAISESGSTHEAWDGSIAGGAEHGRHGPGIVGAVSVAQLRQALKAQHDAGAEAAP